MKNRQGDDSEIDYDDDLLDNDLFGDNEVGQYLRENLVLEDFSSESTEIEAASDELADLRAAAEGLDDLADIAPGQNEEIRTEDIAVEISDDELAEYQAKDVGIKVAKEEQEISELTNEEKKEQEVPDLTPEQMNERMVKLFATWHQAADARLEKNMEERRAARGAKKVASSNLQESAHDLEEIVMRGEEGHAGDIDLENSKVSDHVDKVNEYIDTRTSKPVQKLLDFAAKALAVKDTIRQMVPRSMDILAKADREEVKDRFETNFSNRKTLVRSSYVVRQLQKGARHSLSTYKSANKDLTKHEAKIDKLRKKIEGNRFEAGKKNLYDKLDKMQQRSDPKKEKLVEALTGKQILQEYQSIVKGHQDTKEALTNATRQKFATKYPSKGLERLPKKEAMQTIMSNITRTKGTKRSR